MTSWPTEHVVELYKKRGAVPYTCCDHRKLCVPVRYLFVRYHPRVHARPNGCGGAEAEAWPQAHPGRPRRRPPRVPGGAAPARPGGL